MRQQRVYGDNEANKDGCLSVVALSSRVCVTWSGLLFSYRTVSVCWYSLTDGIGESMLGSGENMFY